MTKYYKVNNSDEFDWLMQHLEDTTDVRWSSGGGKPTNHSTSSMRFVFNAEVVCARDNELLIINKPTDTSKLINVSDLQLEVEQNKALQSEFDPVEKPEHYNKGSIDLIESWYLTYPFNEFRAGMQMIAERYLKRDKNGIEDIDKGMEVIRRLKEYELKELE